MNVISLSDEGQVVIPPDICAAQNWTAGQELIAVAVAGGILIKRKNPFPPTTLAQVAGCLNYQGPPKTLDEMESAIAQGIKEQWHDRS